MRGNTSGSVAEPTIVLGVGAILVLLLFGLLAAVVLTALIIWVIPFAVIIYGIWLLSQGRQMAGMVAVIAGFVILLVATLL